MSSLTIKERKILYLAIAQCSIKDREFYEYSISVQELANIIDVLPENIIRDRKKIRTALARTALDYADDTFTLFDHLSTKNGIFTFEINKKMTDFLLQLRGDFSKPLLQDFMQMRSKHAIAVWHLMQREMRSRKPKITEKINFYLSLDELREVTGTQNKLTQVGQFKIRVLDVAIKDIHDCCGVTITYQNRKNGKKIVGFDFTATNLFYIDALESAEIEKRLALRKK